MDTQKSGLQKFNDTLVKGFCDVMYKVGLADSKTCTEWRFLNQSTPLIIMWSLVAAVVGTILWLIIDGSTAGGAIEGLAGAVKGRQSKARLLEGFSAAPGAAVKGLMNKRGTNALPAAMTRSYGPDVRYGGRNVMSVSNPLPTAQDITYNTQASAEGALKTGVGFRNGYETLSDIKTKKSKVITGNVKYGGEITKGLTRFINPRLFEAANAARQGSEYKMQHGEWQRLNDLEGMRQISKDELKNRMGIMEGMAGDGGVPNTLSQRRKSWDPERRRRGLTSASAKILAGGCNLNAVWDESTDFFRSQFGFPVGYIDNETGHCVTSAVNNLVGAGGANLVTESFGNAQTGKKQFGGRGGNNSGYQQNKSNPGYYM